MAWDLDSAATVTTWDALPELCRCGCACESLAPTSVRLHPTTAGRWRVEVDDLAVGADKPGLGDYVWIAVSSSTVWGDAQIQFGFDAATLETGHTLATVVGGQAFALTLREEAGTTGGKVLASDWFQTAEPAGLGEVCLDRFVALQNPTALAGAQLTN